MRGLEHAIFWLVYRLTFQIGEDWGGIKESNSGQSVQIVGLGGFAWWGGLKIASHRAVVEILDGRKFSELSTAVVYYCRKYIIIQ